MVSAKLMLLISVFSIKYENCEIKSVSLSAFSREFSTFIKMASCVLSLMSALLSEDSGSLNGFVVLIIRSLANPKRDLNWA